MAWEAEWAAAARGHDTAGEATAVGLRLEQHLAVVHPGLVPGAVAGCEECARWVEDAADGWEVWRAAEPTSRLTWAPYPGLGPFLAACHRAGHRFRAAGGPGPGSI
ncbi:hypothetical protein ACFWIA_30525 [Streptomyces sp. NPDC127068]|uniref:hypothetical protein n=1 Tax=Streptomyces sp. NPDC127068 TaxID=3347127 RepID=UPI0036663932